MTVEQKNDRRSGIENSLLKIPIACELNMIYHIKNI